MSFMLIAIMIFKPEKCLRFFFSFLIHYSLKMLHFIHEKFTHLGVLNFLVFTL